MADGIRRVLDGLGLAVAWGCSMPDASSDSAMASPMAVPPSAVRCGKRLVDLGTVGRRLDNEPGVGRERHQTDLELLRQPVDEIGRGLLGGRQAVRIDVGGQHGAGDVHRQHDRGLLARHGQDERGPGEADRQRGNRGEVEHGREVPPPAWRARRDVGQQVDVGEADRVAGTASLDEQIADQGERDDQEGEQQLGTGETHAALPRTRRRVASVSSQLPEVDSTT